MKRITVFCGSSGKRWDSYGASNIARGKLSKKKIELVYGGSNVGLMRAAADGAQMRRDSDR
jgi:predicted Rossmann-fold nucleotide-binding protein